MKHWSEISKYHEISSEISKRNIDSWINNISWNIEAKYHEISVVRSRQILSAATPQLTTQNTQAIFTAMNTCFACMRGRVPRAKWNIEAKYHEISWNIMKYQAKYRFVNKQYFTKYRSEISWNIGSEVTDDWNLRPLPRPNPPCPHKKDLIYFIHLVPTGRSQQNCKQTPLAQWL